MKRSKRISDETTKSILVWTFFSLIAFLFFANSVGFAMALGIIFFIVPLSLPFVFLIIGTRKDPKPVSFVNASRQPVRGSRLAIDDSYQPIGMSDSSFWDFADSSSESYFADSSSGSCFDDSSFIDSSSDFSHDILFDPAYSFMDCNIYHHDD